MANPYPATFIDQNAEGRLVGEVDFTDAANQPGGGGALTLISSTTLGANGTFDVSGISQAYNDLELVIIARGTDGGVFDALGVRFNADAGANYHAQTVQGSGGAGGAASEVASTANQGWAPRYIPAAAAAANIFGVSRFWLPGYASTVWLKSIIGLDVLYATDTATGAVAQVTMSTWLSTAAITRIQLFGATTANLLAGSQLRIYGLL